MPPRFAYWTILIDGKPTAFRARDQQELLPTVAQLKRTNPDVVMKWFARGRLWESAEAERAASQRPKFTAEKRGPEWRPGGAHRDPRERFDKKKRPRERSQWQEKKGSPPRGDRPWTAKPPGPHTPWKPKPAGVRRPWQRDTSHDPRKAWTPPRRDSGVSGERKPWSARREKPGKAWTSARKPWRDHEDRRKRRDDDSE